MHALASMPVKRLTVQKPTKEDDMAFKNKTGNTPISDADFTDEELDLIYGIDRNGVPGEETRKPAKKGVPK